MAEHLYQKTNHGFLGWLRRTLQQRPLVVLALLCLLLALRIAPYLTSPRLPMGYDAWAYLAAARTVRGHQNPYDHATLSSFLPEVAEVEWPGLGSEVPYTPHYLYPPLLALALMPLMLLPFQQALASWLALTVLAALVLVVLLARLAGWQAALLGVAGFPQLWHAIWLGQVNMALAVLMALALLAQRRERVGLAGLWLGLGALLKVTPGVGLLVQLVRGSWRGIAAAAAAAAAMVVLGLLYVPPLRWFEGLGYAISQNFETPGLVSWTGMLHSLLGGPGLIAGYVLAVAVLLVTLARARAVAGALALAAAFLLPLLIARITWDHHAVMALPPLALLYAWSPRGRLVAGGSWLAIALLGSLAIAPAITLCWAACCWPEKVLGVRTEEREELLVPSS